MHNFEKELICYFQEGLLVGENEDLEKFKKRVLRLKQLAKIPFKNPLFGIKSAYAIVDEKKPLLPWFAAVTKFLFEENIVIPKIEISAFAPKETLDHELLHAVKAPFNDSIFEEFLAFEFSNRLRKFFGPLFFDPWEANILAITLLLGFFSPFLYLAGCLLLTFFLCRLFWIRSIYKKGLLEIVKLFNCKNPLPLALLLSEKEWRLLAKKQGNQMLEELMQRDPLRYRQLSAISSMHF